MRPFSLPRRTLAGLAVATALVVGTAASPASAAVVTAPTAVVAAASTTTPEQQVVALINKQRAKAGLPALKSYGAITSAAESWAKHLKTKKIFAHSSSAWRSAKIGASGWKSSGENLAAGQTSAAAAVSAWMKSSGHKANILGKSYKGVGVGYVKGGPYGHYWVVIFGVAKPAIKKGSTPKVSGTATTGAKVTTKSTGWPSGTKLKWQWYREGTAISGATSTSYTVKSADAGKRLRVKVKASNKKYFPASLTSGYSRYVAI
ncbi:CAP domain-containing protein [Microbacterium fluvii]|uniref:CAP domain-containing protein n=1 Tax=Microbacterium fluvii TaxID=415215 RepID=A0ABW2HAP7_9MICO|nr:CAP domain-containing protein [Microbacterium fluvii]MCU4671775.1 CAP domain-containing protein [Microbacterium fluvii]